MNEQNIKYGIEGKQAPEFSQEIIWIDAKGNPMPPIQLADHKGKFKILFGFQSWCPGCHDSGFPALERMLEALKDHDQIVFLAIQTVFEGFQANTLEKVKETQERYKLAIPFGHDIGSIDTANYSSLMYHYRTGGTPWFIFIDESDTVVFNHYHLDTDKAIEFLKTIQ